MASIQRDLPTGWEGAVSLEESCHACLGEGRLRGREGFVRCCFCNGAGCVPTEFGEKVLAMMRHNFKSMLQDAQDG